MIEAGKQVLLAALIVSAAAGCSGWAEAKRDVAMNRFRSTTLDKAAFALDCPSENLQVRLVPEGDAFSNNALVQGCGRRATFVQWKGDWIMESGPGIQ